MTTKRTPTLAELRKLAKQKGRFISLTQVAGPFPLSASDERRGLFITLSALPDAPKGGKK